MKLRLMEHACGCSTVQVRRRSQGACSSLTLALGRRVLATPIQARAMWFCNGSRHEALTRLCVVVVVVVVDVMVAVAVAVAVVVLLRWCC